MRDRLIELIQKAEKQQCLNAVCGDIDSLIDSPRGAEFIADHLLVNGVIVPPCKLGDTVYEINTENPFEEDLRVMESKVECFFIGTSLDIHRIDGKTVFLTREEAEQALKGGEQG